VVDTCTPNTEVLGEAKLSGVQSQPQQCNQFKNSQGYMRPLSLKKKKKNITKQNTTKFPVITAYVGTPTGGITKVISKRFF
jgi:hypothetical protein